MDGIMSSKLFTTREGTIFLGVIAAVIAAVALIVYLNQYRNSVNNSAGASSVLVAKGLIQKGTSGDVIGSSGLYKISSIKKSNVQTSALVDPATLRGQVAVRDIYPGQQLTAADFGPATNSLTQELSQSERAVVLPLEMPQQVGGQIPTAGHVDVWMAQTTKGGQQIVREILQNIYAFGANGGNVTFRVSPQQAGMLIWASQYADKVWLALRPTVGSTQTKPPAIDLGH